MQPENIDRIRQSFAAQAAGFDSTSAGLSSQEWLDAACRAIAPEPEDTVLEVCAGTCLMGRALAPHVSKVICLDATPAMLEQGKRLAEDAGLTNIAFREGLAEELPFKDEAFDIVVTRLSFHHLQDVQAVFDEMGRVLAPSGKLVVADMLASPEPLRTMRDAIEHLRDPSHERLLSAEELEGLFEHSGYRIVSKMLSRLPHTLSGWMDLTHTPKETKAHITHLMEDELQGGAKTGFAPYRNSEGEISFDQQWLLLVGSRSCTRRCTNAG